MTKGSPKTRSTLKQRGGWLTGWLIFILVQSIASSGLIYYLWQQRDDASPVLTILILFAISLADIVAIIGVWFWKRWGLILYAISTTAGIIIGLVLTRSQLIVFHDIVPLAILGYLIKDKWAYFD
jgi:hypothetical protein